MATTLVLCSFIVSGSGVSEGPSLSGGLSETSNRARPEFVAPSAAGRAQTAVRRASAPDTCPSARRAFAFYGARYDIHLRALGRKPKRVITRPKSCAQARYLARVLRAKARAARLRYERWWAREPKLAGETWRDVRLDTQTNRSLLAIARCETGGINGGRPLWTHRNSTYAGALGFLHATWRQFRVYVRPLPPSEAWRASPKEQLAVGRELVRRFGWSPWPTCSRRLGLR